MFGEYVKNRKALGLDRIPFSPFLSNLRLEPDAFEDFYTRPDVSHYYGVFAQSRPQITWVNAIDNGLVFVETGVVDANRVPCFSLKIHSILRILMIQACKAIRSGEFLYCFFRACEMFLKLVLEQERRSGKRCFGVCLFGLPSCAILSNFLQFSRRHAVHVHCAVRQPNGTHQSHL